jgi:hypothetical protein
MTNRQKKHKRKMVKLHFRRRLRRQARLFPGAVHDDFVDAVIGAFRALPVERIWGLQVKRPESGFQVNVTG